MNAASQWPAGRDRPRLCRSGRARARARPSALHACIEFLSACERWRNVKWPLQNLASALVDLDDGRIAPMLRTGAPRCARRVGKIRMDAARRARAAYVLGGLMEHAGVSRPEAASWISKRLAAAKIDVQPDTLIDWRKDANNARAHPAANETYRRLV